MKSNLPFILLPLALFFFVGCETEPEPDQTTLAPPILQSDEPEQPVTNDKKSPAEYQVKFTTTKGDFVLKITRDWSPLAADRFYTLVTEKYYDDCAFFRVVKGFMVQFGINGDPEVSAKWANATFSDEFTTLPNDRGTISFASRGPNTRTSQVFINYKTNHHLQGKYMPFGQVVEGMEVVDALNGEYGEKASSFQGKIQEEGNAFLKENFPNLDYIKTARLYPDEEQSEEATEEPKEEKAEPASEEESEPEQ